MQCSGTHNTCCIGMRNRCNQRGRQADRVDGNKETGPEGNFGGFSSPLCLISPLHFTGAQRGTAQHTGPRTCPPVHLQPPAVPRRAQARRCNHDAQPDVDGARAELLLGWWRSSTGRGHRTSDGRAHVITCHGSSGRWCHLRRSSQPACFQPASQLLGHRAPWWPHLPPTMSAPSSLRSCCTSPTPTPSEVQHTETPPPLPIQATSQVPSSIHPLMDAPLNPRLRAYLVI